MMKVIVTYPNRAERARPILDAMATTRSHAHSPIGGERGANPRGAPMVVNTLYVDDKIRRLHRGSGARNPSPGSLHPLNLNGLHPVWRLAARRTIALTLGARSPMAFLEWPSTS